ncbi:MAG: hypothetical protein ACM37W_22980 [Actinomycetota bacterium]
MASQLISFRLSDEFLAILQSQQQEGETLSLTAQRLLKMALSPELTTQLAGGKQPSADILAKLQELDERLKKLRA